MTDEELRQEAGDLFAQWMADELPPAYDTRLSKLLNEIARRGRSEGRQRRSAALWGDPTLFMDES